MESKGSYPDTLKHAISVRTMVLKKAIVNQNDDLELQDEVRKITELAVKFCQRSACAYHNKRTIYCTTAYRHVDELSKDWLRISDTTIPALSIG